jgi:hypothetical protein
MAVISLTVIPSTLQRISGIPDTVSIVSNIPSMIFYTIDGTTPTLESNVYTTPITLPTDQPNANLQAFATDGTDTSSVLNIVYAPNISNARLPRAVSTPINQPIYSTPGVRGDTPKYTYSQPASFTIDAFNVVDTYFDGYGANPGIYPVISLDAEPPSKTIKHSESDAQGRRGPGIGTLPKTSVLYLPPPPDQTNANLPTYNPKAMVIYHDGRDPDSNRHEIFRPFFDTENWDNSMNGSKYGTTCSKEGDSLPTGTFMKSHYNPRDNTITFYYRDSRTNRWIISKEEFKASSQVSSQRNMSNMTNYISPNSGHGRVYRWMLYSRTGII